MKAAFVWVLLGCEICWAQATDDCKPSGLNIPEAKYPCVYQDNRAMFRVIAPGAQNVTVRIGRGFDMTKGPDGIWSVTTTPLVVGFHYYTLQIDGATVADPSTMTYFGSGWQNSGIEIPEPAGIDYHLARDVPHGAVSRQGYFSKVTGRWRRCFVYTSPGYGTNVKTRCPVLYLLHGWGEDETGWFQSREKKTSESGSVTPRPAPLLEDSHASQRAVVSNIHAGHGSYGDVGGSTSGCHLDAAHTGQPITKLIFGDRDADGCPSAPTSLW